MKKIWIDDIKKYVKSMREFDEDVADDQSMDAGRQKTAHY